MLREPCPDCAGIGCVMGIECELCDGGGYVTGEQATAPGVLDAYQALCARHRAPDLRGALVVAEQRMLAERVRGSYDVAGGPGIARIEWRSAWGSDLHVERRALAVAEECLRAAGREAAVVPGLGWVRVALVAADVADEPRSHEDAVHNEVPRAETESECAALAAE